jgi:hypothetical protein
MNHNGESATRACRGPEATRRSAEFIPLQPPTELSAKHFAETPALPAEAE